MKKDYLLCGVGGQGTILASKLLADTALSKGLEVKATETIGMSQRGGSVVSHIRIGDSTYSPMIPHGKADVLIAFEPAEAVRNLAYLSKEGVLIVANKAIKPITATLSGGNYDGKEMITYLQENVAKVIVVDAEEVCKELGTNKVLNVVLLGASTATEAFGFSAEEIERAISARVPERFLELNRVALKAGASIGGKS